MGGKSDFIKDFKIFKEDFEKEAGLTMSDHMGLYIQYANLRFFRSNRAKDLVYDE